MDVRRLDLLYWQIIYALVIEKQFRIVEVAKDENEIILEDEKNNMLIRLVRRDFNWSNHLKNDMQSSLQKGEMYRRHLSYRQLNIHNIYIMPYPPVDSWEHLFRAPLYAGKRKKTKMTSMLITLNQDVLSVYHKFGLNKQEELFSDAVFDEKISALKEELKKRTRERAKAEKKLFNYGKPFFTYLLLIAIAVLFLLLEINGGSTQVSNLIDFGAKYNPLIEQGEWWRFFTSMFLHIGFVHFFMNSLALYYLGTLVERIYGNWRFFVIYFFAGFVGSVASFAFNEHVAAGASGAIFGCFGALLYFGVVHKKLFFRTIGANVIMILIINIAFGFIVPMVDNSAHIGGLVGGFFAAAAVHLPNHKKTSRQLLMVAGSVVLFIGLYYFGLFNEHKAASPYAELQYAQELVQKEDYERALPLLEEAIKKQADLPEAYFLLAYAQAKTEQYELALQNFLKAVELRDDFHEAYYNISQLYIEFEQYDKALEAVQKALSIKKTKDYEILEKELLEYLRIKGKASPLVLYMNFHRLVKNV